MVDEVRRSRLTSRGTFAYSNLGAAVAGQAVAAAAGTSYAELMERRIFGPLRMSSTSIPPTPPCCPEVAPNPGKEWLPGSSTAMRR